MVKEFDDDGSGLIEFEEFLVLMAKKVETPLYIQYFCSNSILPFFAEDKNLPLRSSGH